MNYGLYLSAAGALSSMHRQDVLANNLANMNTVGFKPDHVETRERLPERIEDPSHFADPKMLLEQLGGGLLVNPTRTSGAQGDLIGSGNPLDLAIDGEGFFTVEGDRGEGNHLTRDGRMTINSDGELVLAASGHHVLDDQGARIPLDSTSMVSIDMDGQIRQNGTITATLGLADVTTDELEKVGDNRFRMKDGAAIPTSVASGRVMQGFSEASAVNPILTLNDMMNAAKAAQANLQLMQAHSKLLDETMNTFGRVA